MITFKNKPKLSGDIVDSKRDELRQTLVPLVEQFIAGDEIFKGKEVMVEFSEEGISSLVCFIAIDSEKFVLKIPLNGAHIAETEALFLKTWEDFGVSVPHIYKVGMLGDSSYLLMQYIEAPTVKEKLEKENEKGIENIYFEAGKILRTMHRPYADGFGKVVGGKGEYNTFLEWINSVDMKNREKYVEDYNLLDNSFYLLAQAKNILISFVGDTTKSSYLHFDFSLGHLFETVPMTVFDPDPCFNHRYIDLGRTLVNYIAQTGSYPVSIVEGYSVEDVLDERALYAAIFINIIYKLPYQHQKGRIQVINNFQKFLSENIHKLESR